MNTGYKVSDVMTQAPVIMRPSATLQECAIEMKQKRVGTLVIGSKSKLEGVLSEKDIVRKTVAEGKNPLNMIAEDVMASEIVTIEPDKDIFEALNKMKDFDVRHLPVIHNNKLIGLLTMKDVLKIEPQLFDMLVEKMELKEEERKPQRSEDGIWSSAESTLRN